MSEPIPIRDNGEPLVDLGGYDFVLEPMYFKRGFSPIQKMYLRKGVAEKLSTIQKTLGGLRFKIWDAWRPREVQAKLYRQHWNTLRKKEPDWTDVEIKEEVETYVASPDLPLPAHLSGGAIDLTLVDTTGRELDMGTPFDHFALEASPHFFETSVRNPGFAQRFRRSAGRLPGQNDRKEFPYQVLFQSYQPGSSLLRHRRGGQGVGDQDSPHRFQLLLLSLHQSNQVLFSLVYSSVVYTVLPAPRVVARRPKS